MRRRGSFYISKIKTFYHRLGERPMEPYDRITRMELMWYLEKFAQFTSERRDEVADIFSKYDEEIQDKFFQNLPDSLEDIEKKSPTINRPH